MADTTLNSIGEYLREIILPMCPATYVGLMPSLQTCGISIQMYGGQNPQNFLGTDQSLYHTTALLHFRSSNYPKASGWCDAAFALLKAYCGDNILGIRLQGATMYLGTTTENLHEFQQTYTIISKE